MRDKDWKAYVVDVKYALQYMICENIPMSIFVIFSFCLFYTTIAVFGNIILCCCSYGDPDIEDDGIELQVMDRERLNSNTDSEESADTQNTIVCI